MKTCTKCGEEKELSEFYKEKRNKSGVTSACKKCLSASQKKYYDKNKDKINEKKKEYYEKNKEKANAYKHQWYLENKERILEERKQYREDNKEYLRDWHKQHKLNNRDKYNAWNSKRRAKKKENYVELTQEEQKIYDKYYEVCKILGTDKYQVDHIIPVHHGGTNHPSNLQILTTYDNQAKGAKLDYKYKYPRFLVEENKIIRIRDYERIDT